jgi:GTP-binding protein YchF
MKIGIVGMPNAGKSTLFNALTRGGAQMGDYPFTTVEPNTAVATVPDERLDALVELLDSSKRTPETIEFNDIAGLVKGASEGEGLGNQFLAAIRETDAICHVVRAHGDDGVPHPDGSVDPIRDAETIEAELMLADLDSAERRIERVLKQTRSNDPEAIAEHAWLEQVIEALQSGRPVRSVPVPDAAADGPRNLSALTSKPILYVANVTEGDIHVPSALQAHADGQDAGSVAVSARIENELAELDPEEAAEMRAELGVGETGLNRLVRAAWDLLGLLTFYTAGKETEAVARSLRRGLTAWDAAGRIHGEIQDAFVRAEVIGWQELIDAGGYPGAVEKGTLRTEGRTYVVQDGDVITIKV